MSDIEIARKANKKNIRDIASKLNLDENDFGVMKKCNSLF